MGILIPSFVPRCVSSNSGFRVVNYRFAKVSTLPTSLSATPVSQNAKIKRKRDIGNGSLPVKRKKSAEAIDQSHTSKPATAEPVAKDSKRVKKQRRTNEASKAKGKAKDALEESDEEEADGELEEAYERKNRRPGKQGSPSTSKNKEESESASDSEVDASQLVHETVAKGDQPGKTRPTRKRIHHESPPDETKEQRDARTIFIGNVPVEVAKSKVCPIFSLFHTLTRVGLTYTGRLL
jgi:nucleolar protein 12